MFRIENKIDGNWYVTDYYLCQGSYPVRNEDSNRILSPNENLVYDNNFDYCDILPIGMVPSIYLFYYYFLMFLEYFLLLLFLNYYYYTYFVTIIYLLLLFFYFFSIFIHLIFFFFL